MTTTDVQSRVQAEISDTAGYVLDGLRSPLLKSQVEQLLRRSVEFNTVNEKYHGVVLLSEAPNSTLNGNGLSDIEKRLRHEALQAGAELVRLMTGARYAGKSVVGVTADAFDYESSDSFEMEMELSDDNVYCVYLKRGHGSALTSVAAFSLYEAGDPIW